MPMRALGEKELGLLRDVIENGPLGSIDHGRMVGRFEQGFAALVGREYGIAMNSGMSVLHSAVMTAGVGAGDEVICDPVVIFGAMAAMYANAVPVFVDVKPDTWNMDPDKIEGQITERTKAIIVTHMCGLPAEMDRIMEIARRHGLFIIEDCAHSILATYKGQCCGTWGDVGAFSFQESKQLSLGDGGMAVTDSRQIADKLGLHGSAPTFHSVGYGLHYNFRMTEVTAAVGLGQLSRIHAYIARFKAVGQTLSGAVEDCPWLVAQEGPDEAASTYHLWGCRFDGDRAGVSREEFLRIRDEERCDAVSLYTGLPAYRHPVIQERMAHGLDCPAYTGMRNRYPEGTCPVAEDLAPRILLVWTWMTEDEARQTAERLHRVTERLS